MFRVRTEMINDPLGSNQAYFLRVVYKITRTCSRLNMTMGLFLPSLLHLFNFLAFPLPLEPKTPPHLCQAPLLLCIHTFLVLSTIYLRCKHNLVHLHLVYTVLDAVVYFLVFFWTNFHICRSCYGRKHKQEVQIILRTFQKLTLFLNRRNFTRKIRKIQKVDARLMGFVLPIFVLLIFSFYFTFNLQVAALFGLTYFHCYILSIGILKISCVLQIFKNLTHEMNLQLIESFKNPDFFQSNDFTIFIHNYSKLLDLIKHFNNAFGLEIFLIVIVTPLVILQAILLCLLELDLSPNTMIVVYFNAIFKTLLFTVSIFISFLAIVIFISSYSIS